MKIELLQPDTADIFKIMSATGIQTKRRGGDGDVFLINYVARQQLFHTVFTVVTIMSPKHCHPYDLHDVQQKKSGHNSSLTTWPQVTPTCPTLNYVTNSNT